MRDLIALIAIFIPFLVIYYWVTKATMTKWFKFCWRKQLNSNESTNNDREVK